MMSPFAQVTLGPNFIDVEQPPIDTNCTKVLIFREWTVVVCIIKVRLLKLLLQHLPKGHSAMDKALSGGWGLKPDMTKVYSVLILTGTPP